MKEISDIEVFNMHKKIEKLPGLDLFINMNYDKLTKEEQVAYVLAAERYLTELSRLSSKITSKTKPGQTMGHRIVFDKQYVVDPYDSHFLKEYPLFITYYIYAPLDNNWFEVATCHELNKYIEVYIPDPHASLSEEEAVDKAIKEAQAYIHERIRIRNEWEEIRKHF